MACGPSIETVHSHIATAKGFGLGRKRALPAFHRQRPSAEMDNGSRYYSETTYLTLGNSAQLALLARMLRRLEYQQIRYSSTIRDL